MEKIIITSIDELVLNYDIHENEVQNNLDRYTDFTWEQFDTDELKALVKEFNTFTDSPDYLQRNYILLTSAMGVAKLDDNEELSEEFLSEDGVDYNEKTREVYYCPENLYIYIYCTEAEARKFLANNK